MARNRVIYQSEGLYVSKAANSTGSGDHAQLKRVQSANYSFNITRQDVNQYGELARIDSIVLESPTVSLDFSYYLTDGENEKALGFFVSSPTGTGAGWTASKPKFVYDSQSQFPSGQLNDLSGLNFYILTTNEGDDLKNESTVADLTGKSVIGIGNAYLTDYSVEFAVGSIPTVSVSLEGSNMNASILQTGSNGSASLAASGAGINQESGTSLGTLAHFKLPSSKTGSASDLISALRPGDVTLSFGNMTGSGIVSDLGVLHVQSASLSLPLGRTPIDRLGSKFAFVRTVDFPVTATLTVNGVQSDNGNAKSLIELIDANPKQEITLKVKRPGFSLDDADNAVEYTFKNAQLDSASVSSSIGSNKAVDFTFTTQIGGANDTVNGIQMRGVHSGSVFQ